MPSTSSSLNRSVRVPVDPKEVGDEGYRAVRPSNVLAALDDEQRDEIAQALQEAVGFTNGDPLIYDDVVRRAVDAICGGVR